MQSGERVTYCLTFQKQGGAKAERTRVWRRGFCLGAGGHVVCFGPVFQRSNA